MLNLSHNSVDSKVQRKEYKSFAMLNNYPSGKIFTRLLVFSLFVVILTLFLPWTQNIRSKGYVTHAPNGATSDASRPSAHARAR